MALIFKTPSECADEYLTTLKNLKPEVDISRKDSDWWIRSQVVGGVISGVYGDQSKLSDDAFPQSSRREATQKHLQTYFGRDFNPPQSSIGTVGISGVPGSPMPANTEFIYTPNGNTYKSISPITMVGASGTVDILSDGTGQTQNLLDGAQLTLSAPPSGFNSTANAIGPIGGGRDEETNSEAATLILDFIRQPPAGGTAADYKRFAQQADASVVDANVIRFINGLGTLGIVITAGTTDIDTAVNNGDPVVREPSDALVEIVQDYVNTQKVETDCVSVFGPQAISVDVEVKVRYLQGNNSTIVSAFGLTQKQLVQREVKRAMYKTPPGGRQFNGNGYIVASEIEQVIDIGLSGEPYETGLYVSILADRQVQDLSATGSNLLILPTQIAEPGTITVTEM